MSYRTERKQVKMKNATPILYILASNLTKSLTPNLTAEIFRSGTSMNKAIPSLC